MDQRGHEIDYALHCRHITMCLLLFLQEIFSGFALFRIRPIVSIQPGGDIAITRLLCSLLRLFMSALIVEERNKRLTGVASASGHMTPSFGG